jgi:hypothetical protein
MSFALSTFFATLVLMASLLGGLWSLYNSWKRR